MLGEMKMHDVVALLQDVPAKRFETGRNLLLRRGQIGTVVMSYPDGAYEVEFADRDGIGGSRCRSESAGGGYYHRMVHSRILGSSLVVQMAKTSGGALGREQCAFI